MPLSRTKCASSIARGIVFGVLKIPITRPGRPPIPANSELRFELELVAVDNSIIRKFRRGVGDFLRPPGNQYVSAEEKAQIEAGTMEKPLLERLFNDVTNKEK